jgi:hypothetical protein
VENILQELAPLGQFTGTGLFLAVAWMVITRRLVWHTDLQEEKADAEKLLASAVKERDEWKGIALSLLGVTEKLTIQAEVTNEVMSRLPQPPTDTDARK